MARRSRKAAGEADEISTRSAAQGMDPTPEILRLIGELADVAARLVRLNLTDTGELLETAEELARIAATNPGVTAPVRRRIEDAAIRIARICQATTQDPAADFAEANRSLGRVMDDLRARDAPTTPSVAATVPGKALTAEAAEVAEAAADHEEPARTPTAVETIVIPPDADRSIIGEFVTECLEYISGAEAALLALETNPDEVEAINTVFRAFHTIKGTSGFLGFDLVTNLAHKAENLLSRARDRQIRCTGGYADLALQSADTLKALIEGIHAVMGGEVVVKPANYDRLITTLIDPEAAGITSAERGDLPTDGGRNAGADESNGDANKAAAAAPRGPEPGPRVAKKGGWKADESSDSVRVRTDRLDRLINMVGELVIAQSMVAQDEGVVIGSRPELIRKVGHAGKIVRELQDLTMSMRMVPLKPTFQKMARLVRDLAHKGGRQVDFVTSGDETEIDRNMVDVIGDPLVHMIRNAVDHGIEPPDQRVECGKPRVGNVSLSAYHAGGNVVVELRDDGRGLDRARITAKAISKGLIESEKGMSDSEVFNLIFEPGFSTAEKVTEVSGRGVGMDVVRRAVHALRGRIEIRSVHGHGTTFVVKLPLTLALTDGMLIRVGAQRFIVPTGSIEMSLRPEAGVLSKVVGRGEMVMLRGALVPMIRLHRVFGIPDAVEDPTAALLVVIDDGESRSAILVDELLGQQQVVAKSLGMSIKVAGIAGGAILGDGRVGLIVDPSGLVSLARSGKATDPGAAFESLAA